MNSLLYRSGSSIKRITNKRKTKMKHLISGIIGIIIIASIMFVMSAVMGAGLYAGYVIMQAI